LEILKLGDIIGDQVIQVPFGTRALDVNFAHVADIKEPGRLSTSPVLIQDPGVLDRKFPAPEVDQATPKFLMFLE
jgi:hypothetical protein